MFCHSHTTQGRHRFTLTSRSYNHRFLSGELIQLIQINQDTLGDIQITKFSSYLHNSDHAASCNTNVAAFTGSSIEDLLNAMDVRGKGGD